MEGLACTKLFVEGLCSSTFTGLVAAATSYAFNPLGALQANTSISSYSSSGSTSSGSYLNQSFTANFGGFMPMTFNSSQQYDSDYSMTSSRYGMSFGDYTGLPTLTNTALSASAVTSNTQSDSSWLGKVWGGIKYFGEQYWDGLKTGRQRDKIYNWANSAGEFFNAEVSSFSKSGDEMLNSAYRGLDTFAKGGLGYLLDKSKDVETLVTKVYNQAVNNPGATFIDAPLNYLQSIPSRAETTWEIMKSPKGGEYTGDLLFDFTMMVAPGIVQNMS